jgi:predicted phage terminase large subunit-like protein
MERVFTGKIDRLRIHMPPRHGKTETVTIRGVLYLLATRPLVRILVTAYNERFARKLGRKIRNEAIRMGIRLSEDKTASDEWYTADGSLVMARGVGSPPTGEGFDFIFIDDPVRRREDADSVVYRDKVWDWYTDDLLSRLQPQGALIGVWTRWHEDDLAGRLKAQEADGGDVWAVLSLPAISPEGDALWPEVWPLNVLLRRRRAMVKRDGERSWEALFQQNPTPAQGDLFDISKLSIIEQAPADIVARARAWDAAASKNAGDYTVGVEVGRTSSGQYVILDLVRGRWDTGERDRRMRETAEQDGTDCVQVVPQDPGSAGKSQAVTWVKNFAGFTVRIAKPTRNKSLRAGPVSTQVNNGNFLILKRHWTTDMIEELRQFPGGNNDDQVDALGDAFAAVIDDGFEWFVVVA